MIDFEGTYTSSKPCSSGEGSYFSRLRTRSGSHIQRPLFVGLGGAVPNMGDPVALARDVWARAQDQNTDPGIKWYDRRPLLMDVGRICLRGRHEDGARTSTGHRFELLGSIVITGERVNRYDDINLMGSRFDSTGLGELRVQDRNIRGLHPALATATIQRRGGYPVQILDERPIQYGLETKESARSTTSVFFAMRGHEMIVSYADMMAAAATQATGKTAPLSAAAAPEDIPPF